MMRHALAVVCALTIAVPAEAGSRTLKPGEVWGVGEDFVLSGDDVLDAQGTAERPCQIAGNGDTIKTAAGWRGRVVLRHCEIRGMGGARKPALDLTASGEGDQIVIEHCDFLASGAVHLNNQQKSATMFRGNTIHANSMVPVTNLPSESAPSFRATGESPTRKLFQGNRVYKSIVQFENTRNWLIGGDSDVDSNILIGMRAAFTISRCADTVVRGNYVHTDIPSFRWSQVHTLSVQAPCPNLVVEHNILRHGQWVVRGLVGEFRYNLVLDADGHNFIIGPSGKTHIHHNIFARYCTVDPNLNATIGVVYKGDDIQIYNNTFDGGGTSMQRPWHVPVVEVVKEAMLHSLRSNAFVHHPTKFNMGTATIRPGFTERITDPAPERLGYADYNLFFNPAAAERKNYALAVAGKTERADAGFGKHDVPANGARNDQAEPKFTGPLPRKFPFTDEDVKSGKVTVSQILAHYRQAYGPAEGSPLLGAGDPADGAGNFIGAVGAGKDAPNDRFGRFGAK